MSKPEVKQNGVKALTDAARLNALLAKARAKYAKVEAVKKELAELTARHEKSHAEYHQERFKAVSAGCTFEKPVHLAPAVERIEALEAAVPVLTRELESEVKALQTTECMIAKKHREADAKAREAAIDAAYQKVADGLSDLARIVGGEKVHAILTLGDPEQEIERRLPKGCEQTPAPNPPAGAWSCALTHLYRNGLEKMLASAETLCE